MIKIELEKLLNGLIKLKRQKFIKAYCDKISPDINDSEIRKIIELILKI